MSAEPTVVRRRGTLLADVAALRPHQWTKNVLVFAGVLFAGQLHDMTRLLEALVTFAAYCMLSSAGYLVNDVRDREADRLHPVKRFRPIAQGDVSVRRALWLAGVLAATGLVFEAALGAEALAFAAAFVVGQLAYTFWLKRMVIVDAIAIACLFVIRAAGGAAAVDVRISGWLLLCTASLAMFLAFGKRRAELLAVTGLPEVGRVVLRRYSPVVLGRLVVATAAAASLTYVVYALRAPDWLEMAATIPFVLFGLGRYLFLMRRRDLGEEPDRVLYSDVPILVSVVLWAAAAATGLNAA
jgi:4-hydroxybenzoate polyprenyltransferase